MNESAFVLTRNFRSIFLVLLVSLVFVVASCTWDNPADEGGDEELNTTVMSWSAVPSPCDADVLTGIYGLSASSIYVVGTDGAMAYFDGSSWTQLNSGTSENLLGVWGHDEHYVAGSTSDYEVSLVSVGVNTIPGTYAVDIIQPPTRANVAANTSNTAPLANDETLTLNSVEISLTAGMTLTQVRDRINDFNWYTKATASIDGNQKLQIKLDAIGTETISVVSNKAASGESSGIGTTVLHGTGAVVSGTIGGNTATGDGDMLSGGAGTAVENLTLRISEHAGTGPRGTVSVTLRDKVVRSVGVTGTIIEYAGAGWNHMHNASPMTLYDVWGTSGYSTWAAGDKMLLRFDDMGWRSALPSPEQPWCGERFHSIWGSSSTDVFAVGTNGTIVHFDGVMWETHESNTEESLHGVCGTSGTNVFAVGQGGTILRFNGSSWSEMTSGVTYPILGVWGRAFDDVFAVGSYGTILHYDGSVWTEMDSGTDKSLRSVWGTADGDVFAVGEGATILRYGR